MDSVNNFYPAAYEGISLSALLLEENVTYHGWLFKKSGGLARLSISLFNAYEKRYFVIIKGWVYYYKDVSSTKPQGQFSLEGYSKRVLSAEEEYESAPWVFKIFPSKSGGRIWYFSATNETKMKAWMESFRSEIEHYNIPPTSLRPSQSYPRSKKSPLDHEGISRLWKSENKESSKPSRPEARKESADGYEKFIFQPNYYANLQSKDDSKSFDPRDRDLPPIPDPRDRDLPPIPDSNIDFVHQQEKINRLTDKLQNYSLMTPGESPYLLPSSRNKSSQTSSNPYEASQSSSPQNKQTRDHQSDLRSEKSSPFKNPQTLSDAHKPPIISNSSFTNDLKQSISNQKPTITGLKPAIVKNKPVVPKPIGPKPVGLKPVSPKPAGHKQIGPKPIGPKPVGPKPVGPKPVGPKPVGHKQIGPTDSVPGTGIVTTDVGHEKTVPSPFASPGLKSRLQLFEQVYQQSSQRTQRPINSPKFSNKFNY